MLAQIPLTVSPFVSLPVATTLPYTYKSVPSHLPPSSTGEDPENPRPKYVISQSGHAAHPDEIIASCKALQAHLQKLQDDADATLKEWQEQIQQRELAEKRRVAPGWLDREEKILEPQRAYGEHGMGKSIDAGSQMDPGQAEGRTMSQSKTDEGQAIDRAFGGLDIN